MQEDDVELQHFNPVFRDYSVERTNYHVPPEGTQYQLARYRHPTTSKKPESELQREGAYGLYHHHTLRYGESHDTDENAMENMLKQLPSRQLETAADLVVKTLHRQKKSEVEDVLDSGDAEDEVMEETVRAVRASMSTKRDLLIEELRLLGQGKRFSSKKKNRPGKVLRMKYSLGMHWKHFKEGLEEAKYTLYLWRSRLKKIEGQFGSGVLSYFLFLKWLLFINIPTVLLTLGFLFVPQLLFQHLERDTPVSTTPGLLPTTPVPPGSTFTTLQNITGNGSITQETTTVTQPDGNTTLGNGNVMQEEKSGGDGTSFTGLELLTGAGWFTNTTLYYGHYTNEKIQILGDSLYRMQLAYLFTSGGYYLLTLIILAHSILRSYTRFYIDSSGVYNMYFMYKVLGSWDYTITSPEAIKLQHRSFYVEITEYLAGTGKSGEHKQGRSLVLLVLQRLCSNLLVLALLGGSGYLFYFLSEQQAPDSSDDSEEPLLLLVLPLVIGIVHLIVPIIFSVIEHYEGYQQPKYELYVHMVRSLLLRLSTLGVLVYYWYNKVARSDAVTCWETYVGQEVYRLVIVELIFSLLGTFFSEFVRRLLSGCSDKVERANFAVGRYTLELIYAQTLCWLGTFYAPLLSLIVCIKFIIIFYVKQTSALLNCQPSTRPWRASRAHTIFLLFLFISYMFATIAVAVGIIFVEPSKLCGPYQGKKYMYSIVSELVEEGKEDHRWLTDIIHFISSPGFISAILIMLGMAVYYVRTVMIGRKETVMRLQQQLVLEGKDKTFLLNLLNEVSQRGGKTATSPSRPFSTPDRDSAGGRVFVRTIAEGAAGARKNNFSRKTTYSEQELSQPPPSDYERQPSRPSSFFYDQKPDTPMPAGDEKPADQDQKKKRKKKKKKKKPKQPPETPVDGTPAEGLPVDETPAESDVD